jgi:hypothetical protein
MRAILVAMRVIGGVVGLLIGVVGMILAGWTVLAGLSEGHIGWVLGVLLVPLAATSLSGGWAALARRRVRPVLGVGLAATALVYSTVEMVLTVLVSYDVARSPSLLAGIAFIVLLPLWPAVVLLTLLAAILLRGQRVRGFPLFLGTALAWVAAWVGFWIFMLPRALPSPPLERGLPGEMPIPLITPAQAILRVLFRGKSLVIHAFFLLPALLALLLGRWATRDRSASPDLPPLPPDAPARTG